MLSFQWWTFAVISWKYIFCKLNRHTAFLQLKSPYKLFLQVFFVCMLFVFIYSDRRTTKMIHTYIKSTFWLQSNPETSFVCLNGWTEFQSKILPCLVRMNILKPWECESKRNIEENLVMWLLPCAVATATSVY